MAIIWCFMLLQIFEQDISQLVWKKNTNSYLVQTAFDRGHSFKDNGLKVLEENKLFKENCPEKNVL